MKLKLFVSAFILAGFVGGLWAANDPVLMTVNNKKVTLSEFEYLYKKNLEQQVNKESLDEYVDRFIVYKLKVAEAEINRRSRYIGTPKDIFTAHRKQEHLEFAVLAHRNRE